MPLFEHICSRCSRKFSVLVGMTQSPDSEQCPHCGSSESIRKVSRFARPRPGATEADSADETSPAAMRAWAKELGKEAGEDLGDEFEEYLEAVEDDA